MHLPVSMCRIPHLIRQLPQLNARPCRLKPTIRNTEVSAEIHISPGNNPLQHHPGASISRHFSFLQHDISFIRVRIGVDRPTSLNSSI